MKREYKNNSSMRDGFAMITAIFVIVIMATVSMFILDISGKMVKETTYQYRRAQAKLLAQSYTELAILAASKYNRSTNSNCVETIHSIVNGIDPLATPNWSGSVENGYEVNTTIYYIGNNLPCSATHILNSDIIAGNKYQTLGRPDQISSIIVDVLVRYKDPDTPSSSTQWISYRRRSLQKI
jgi:type II secretory pathway pseudopilin PulG